MNRWQSAPTSELSHKYYRYGNETWIASNINAGRSNSQPNQTLLIPVHKEVNSNVWVPSETYEYGKYVV